MTNGIRITADMATATTKVVDIATGVEIKGIRKITLTAEPGSIWIAQIELAAMLDITAKVEMP